MRGQISDFRVQIGRLRFQIGGFSIQIASRSIQIANRSVQIANRSVQIGSRSVQIASRSVQIARVSVQIARVSAGIARCLAGAGVCALLVAGAARTGQAAEVIDRVLAVVAGELIMLSDLNAARDLHLIAVGDVADPPREFLSRLIDRALILAEAERYAPPEPAAEAIAGRAQAVRASFPTSEAYEMALARVGFDERHLRERIRQDLRIAAYLEQRFVVQSPSDDDLRRYFQEHPQDFARDGRLLPFDEARAAIVEAVTAERRQKLVDEWVAGLRRRAEITEPPALDATRDAR